MYGLDVLQDGPKLGQRVAQQAQVIQGTTLKLVVKGQSYLEAGDLIEFRLRSVDEKNPDGEEDPQYSGKYVITKIRHQITSDIYTMVLECAKDSVANPIVPGNPQYKAAYERGELEDLHGGNENFGTSLHR